MPEKIDYPAISGTATTAFFVYGSCWSCTPSRSEIMARQKSIKRQETTTADINRT
jgi:hypothetical protein